MPDNLSILQNSFILQTDSSIATYRYSGDSVWLHLFHRAPYSHRSTGMRDFPVFAGRGGVRRHHPTPPGRPIYCILCNYCMKLDMTSCVVRDTKMMLTLHAFFIQ